MSNDPNKNYTDICIWMICKFTTTLQNLTEKSVLWWLCWEPQHTKHTRHTSQDMSCHLCHFKNLDVTKIPSSVQDMPNIIRITFLVQPKCSDEHASLRIIPYKSLLGTASNAYWGLSSSVRSSHGSPRRYAYTLMKKCLFIHPLTFSNTHSHVLFSSSLFLPTPSPSLPLSSPTRKTTTMDTHAQRQHTGMSYCKNHHSLTPPFHNFEPQSLHHLAVPWRH